MQHVLFTTSLERDNERLERAEYHRAQYAREYGLNCPQVVYLDRIISILKNHETQKEIQKKSRKKAPLTKSK